MNYERFILFVTEIVDELPSYAYRSYGDGGDGFRVEDDVIIQSHVSHGAEGGNCWGDEAEYFSNDRPPEDFLPLEKILLEVNPRISYLEYKSIEKLIKEGQKSESEYYGNHTTYVTFSLDIRELYKFLFPDESLE